MIYKYYFFPTSISAYKTLLWSDISLRIKPCSYSHLVQREKGFSVIYIVRLNLVLIACSKIQNCDIILLKMYRNYLLQLLPTSSTFLKLIATSNSYYFIPILIAYYF